jgi:antibiotic biosynthesis monooxygenase (ABM) superfamily enzyme
MALAVGCLHNQGSEEGPMESERGPVTAVVTRDVTPGHESDYEEWAHRVVSASGRYGATGHTLLTPDPAAPTRRVLIVQFPDEDGVRAWDESKDRDELVKEAEEFSSLHIQRATGLETWFALPGRRAIVPPPRWKQLLATLVGAYPLVVLMSAFVLPRLTTWPLLLRSIVFPVVLLTLMTYVVMPLVTKAMRGWLYPPRRDQT